MNKLLIKLSLPSRQSCAFFQRYISHKSFTISGTNDSNVTSKTVVISESNDIYANLALEDWLYENTDFGQQEILMLWRNNPCVVIGRHQNPWKECSIQELNHRCIQLARRESGGGTVYHDLGNMNCTFFTTKERYNKGYYRDNNLQLVTQALKQKWPHLQLEINERDDIILEDEYKVSGTAAKVGRYNAYHHFTLLLNSDTSIIPGLLKNSIDGLKSKATASLRTQVKNLADSEPDVTYEKVVSAISTEYLKEQGEQSGFMQRADPMNEEAFPGIGKIKSELNSWKWMFGKTPKFEVERTLMLIYHDKPCKINLRLIIDKCTVRSIHLWSQTLHISDEYLAAFNENFKNIKFSSESIRVMSSKFLEMEKYTNSVRFELTDSICQHIQKVAVDFFE